MRKKVLFILIVSILGVSLLSSAPKDCQSCTSVQTEIQTPSCHPQDTSTASTPFHADCQLCAHPSMPSMATSTEEYLLPQLETAYLPLENTTPFSAQIPPPTTISLQSSLPFITHHLAHLASIRLLI